MKQGKTVLKRKKSMIRQRRRKVRTTTNNNAKTPQNRPLTIPAAKCFMIESVRN